MGVENLGDDIKDKKKNIWMYKIKVSVRLEVVLVSPSHRADLFQSGQSKWMRQELAVLM